MSRSCPEEQIARTVAAWREGDSLLASEPRLRQRISSWMEMRTAQLLGPTTP